MGIPSRGDWFVVGEGNTHQRWREAGESGDDFTHRAMRTYWKRANACADPVRARAYLAGMEKIVMALCESRKQAEFLLEKVGLKAFRKNRPPSDYGA